MNILFIDRNAKVGGRNTYLRGLAPPMREAGHRCLLLCGGGPWLSITRSVFDAVANHPPVDFLAQRAVARALSAWSIDVVAAQTTTCARHAVAACQAAGTPLVMHIHNRTNMDDAGPATDSAARIVVMNENTAQHVREVSPPCADKVFVSILPVNPVAFGPLPARGGPGFRALYLARLSRTKGVHAFTAMAAAEMVVADVPGFTLTVVGGRGARLRHARREAASINARHGREVVVVEGQTQDPRRRLADADLVMGAGYVALEALSMNRRVVGVGFAGIFGGITEDNLAEAIDANFGDTGALEADTSAATLRDAILQAHASHAAGGHDAWSHRAISELCAPRRVAEQVLGVYQDAVAGAV